MKNALKFLPLLLFLPLLASGQKRLNEVGAVYGAIRSMTPEAYKEAHDKYGIRWIEAWTGNLTGGTEEQYDAWIERFNNAMNCGRYTSLSRARLRTTSRTTVPNGVKRRSKTGSRFSTARRASASSV